MKSLKRLWDGIKTVSVSTWVTFGLTAVAAFAVGTYFGALTPLVKPTTVQEFWGLIDATSNALLLIVAAIGLKALVLTRRGLLTQNKREALESAVCRSKEFADEIIPTNEPILSR
jgi:hypothetical protein